MDWNWSEYGVSTVIRGEPWDEDDTIPVSAVATRDEGAEPEAALNDGQRKTFEVLRTHPADLYALIIEALEHEFEAHVADLQGTQDDYEDEDYNAYEDQLYGQAEDAPGAGAPIADHFDTYDDHAATDDAEDKPFEELFSIEEIVIFDTDGPSAEWGVVGHAEFEPEHGWGIIFDYNFVIETGYQDVMLARIR